MIHRPVVQNNRKDTSELLSVVLKNIPAARRVAEAHRVGARDAAPLQAAS
jgi:hypothetical protein